MAAWFSSARTFSANFLYKNALIVPPEPDVFSPLDLSDCYVWLDANDSSTIEVNTDTSGVNVNRVMKWFDKANPSQQNHFEKDNQPYESGLYNVHTMNGLNTVYFEPNTYMIHHDGGYTFPFQARTFFAVIKPLTDLSDASGILPFISTFNGSTTGDMNTGFTYDSSGAYTGLYRYQMCENGYECGITFDLSNNPVNQRMILMFAQTDQLDLSGNAGVYDTIYQSLSISSIADQYNTSLSQYYLNNATHGTAQDIAEIILYGRLLSSSEQIQVLEYLADKWNASGPGYKY